MKKFINNAYEKYNFLSHFIGVLIGVIALVFVNIYIVLNNINNSLDILGINIFIICIILLYSASSYYHYISDIDKNKLLSRKLDHSMIFFLIAGSYTPICFKYLPDNRGIIFVCILFIISILGIIMKIYWLNAPRVLYTLLYLIMGWSILFDYKSFIGVPIDLLIIILISGISYTIGAIIYIIKRPNYKLFGFHEIFHCFILCGTLIQLFAYVLYIL